MSSGGARSASGLAFLSGMEILCDLVHLRDRLLRGRSMILKPETGVGSENRRHRQCASELVLRRSVSLPLQLACVVFMRETLSAVIVHGLVSQHLNPKLSTLSSQPCLSTRKPKP